MLLGDRRENLFSQSLGALSIRITPGHGSEAVVASPFVCGAAPGIA